MDAELAEQCTDQLVLTRFDKPDPRTGKDLYHEDAPIPVHGKIEQFTHMVLDSEKRTVASNTRIFVLPQDDLGADLGEITVKDRITLPAGYTPATPPIISVGRENDPDGGSVYAWVVHL